MSNVKLCDDCASIFPEGVQGASVGSHYDPETGRQVADDWCPDCAAKRKERKAGLVWRRETESAKELEAQND